MDTEDVRFLDTEAVGVEQSLGLDGVTFNFCSQEFGEITFEMTTEEFLSYCEINKSFYREIKRRRRSKACL